MQHRKSRHNPAAQQQDRRTRDHRSENCRPHQQPKRHPRNRDRRKRQKLADQTPGRRRRHQRQKRQPLERQPPPGTILRIHG